MRDTGIANIGLLPWGAHFCQFYQEPQDLIDILVPYFAAGLQAHEGCLWITSGPLGVAEAKAALAAAVGELDGYFSTGQLEILDYRDWYTAGGQFDAARVLRGWVEKLTIATARGFAGLRLSGNTCWLEEPDWQTFTAYETDVDRVLAQHRMMALCTYSLTQCGPVELMEVVSNHEFALLKRRDAWCVFQSPKRKQLESSLREREARLRLQWERMPIGCLVYDANFAFAQVNPAAEQIFGFSAEELIGQPANLIVPPAVHAEVDAILQRIAAGDMAAHNINENVTKDGRTILCQWANTPLRDPDGQVIGLLSMVQDITERQKREEELHRLNRTLAAHSHSDQAMMRATDEAQYIAEICRIIVNDCGHAMVWIGMAEEDEEKSVRPIAAAGFEDGYLDTLQITWADTERGRGPTGTAIRTGQPALCRNMLNDPQFAPWREQALRRGYASSIVLPLLADGKAFGAITIYSREPDPFSESEIALLSELADDLAYGIMALRLRATHAQAEAALRESEENIRAILDAAQESIYLFDGDGTVLVANTTAAARLGMAPRNVIGHRFEELIPPEVAAARMVRLQSVFTTGKPVRFEDERNSIIFDHHFFPVFHDGQVIRVAAFSQDITERKRGEEALKRLAAIIESSDDAIIGKTLDGTITSWNPAAEQLYGYTAQEAIGMSINRLTPPDYAAELDDILARIARNEFVAHHETVRIDKAGRRMEVSLTLSPIRDAGGNVVGASSITRDITERKRAEEALRKTAAELAQSNRELEQFAYVASHDLQEPLRAVSGYVSLIEARLQDTLDEKTRQYIDGTIQGAARMQQLITDLLALSRVGTQGKPFVPTDLNTVLAQALMSVSVSTREAGATITHDPLPTLSVDAGQLVLLFQNLLGNAIKFHGERPPVIHIGAQPHEDHWLFSVRDNGIGIEPQYYERIFLIFQRLHTRKQYPGTGIGLAICKKIVERHAGSIWVESRPEEGTTFYFTIPRVGAAAI